MGQILWAGKAEKGEVTGPLMTTYGAKFQISNFFLMRRIPSARFTPNAIMPLGDHRQARGTHINVGKPQKIKFSCHGTFNQKRHHKKGSLRGP